jgi:hypothetical protein
MKPVKTPDGRIYELRHPVTGSPFYVGETVRELHQRLYDHVTAALNPPDGKFMELRGCIREMQPLSPSIHLLEDVMSLGDAREDKVARLEHEAHWISVRRGEGHALFNKSFGIKRGHVFAEGTGPRKLRGRRRPDVSAALSGKVQDPDAVARRAESLRGRNEALKASGEWDSPERRAMRSERVRASWASRRGRPESEETRERRRQGQLRRRAKSGS